MAGVGGRDATRGQCAPLGGRHLPPPSREPGCTVGVRGIIATMGCLATAAYSQCSARRSGAPGVGRSADGVSGIG
jgi:hypothetical protein